MEERAHAWSPWAAARSGLVAAPAYMEPPPCARSMYLRDNPRPAYRRARPRPLLLAGAHSEPRVDVSRPPPAPLHLRPSTRRLTDGHASTFRGRRRLGFTSPAPLHSSPHRR